MNALALVFLAIWTAVILKPKEPAETQSSNTTKGKQKTKKASAPHPAATRNSIPHSFYLWAMAILMIISIGCQISSARRHAAYDTDVAQKYEDKFSGDFMALQRLKAAKALDEYNASAGKKWDSLTNGIAGLDYVLGFFDELGYDEAHGKISVDVVHEYFYDDMRAYYQASEKYIAYAQKTDSMDDFEYVKPLLDAVTEVESKKTGKSSTALIMSDKDLADYIRSEIDLKKDK